MRVAIIGKKVGMTQIFSDTGTVIPVTVVDTSDCLITQVKTKAKDGYAAIQVGFGNKKQNNVGQPLKGHYKKANTAPKAQLQEIRVDDESTIAHLEAGKALAVNMFAKGDVVDVIATSKGKGFQGVMKRHHFAGSRATHGSHEYFRHGGAAGCRTFPGKVWKNKRMPGQMGNVRKTIQNLEIVDVRPKEKLLLIKGSVPGADNTFVMVRSALKAAAPSERAWVR